MYKQVEKFHQKGGYSMVEFFHPLADGGKIPPYRWRYWTTFIGGIFHLFRLQCTNIKYSWSTHGGSKSEVTF